MLSFVLTEPVSPPPHSCHAIQMKVGNGLLVSLGSEQGAHLRGSSQLVQVGRHHSLGLGRKSFPLTQCPMCLKMALVSSVAFPVFSCPWAYMLFLLVSCTWWRDNHIAGQRRPGKVAPGPFSWIWGRANLWEQALATHPQSQAAELHASPSQPQTQGQEFLISRPPSRPAPSPLVPGQAFAPSGVYRPLVAEDFCSFQNIVWLKSCWGNLTDQARQE